MKRLRKKPLYFALLILSLHSCKKDNENNCSYNSFGEGRYVFCPDTVAVGDTITVTFMWENTIDCQKELGFTDTINGNIRTIALETQIDNCNCDNSEAGVSYQNYAFIAPHTGIQIIKTYKKPGVYETDTVIVQ